MALDNLISVEFTPAEITTISDALTSIENILKGKVVNLTASQRREYGRLGDKTENFVNKVGIYVDQKPEIVPYFVDKTEVRKDAESRAMLTPILKRMQSVYESIDDTHKLLGWDFYNNVIAIYRNIKMLSKQNVPGINAIYDDLKKQFPHNVSLSGGDVVDIDPQLDEELNS